MIAHPDDEAMFFVPAILNLQKYNEISVLCLSNGNYAGLGKIREKELVKSCEALAISAPTTLDEPDLQDGPILWKPDAVLKAVQRYLKQNPHDIVMTFDHRGVSSHPNHISTFQGCRLLKNTTLLSLRTINICRKYCSLLEVFWCKPEQHHFFNLSASVNFRVLSQHHSQYVWFRKLFVLFSSYTFVNSFDIYKQ